MFLKNLIPFYRPTFTCIEDIYTYVKPTLTDEEDRTWLEFVQWERRFNEQHRLVD